MSVVGIYNLYLFGSWMTAYGIGSRIAHRFLNRSGMLGGLMLMVGLLLLLLLQEDIQAYYRFVGAAIGAAGGFFFVAYNLYFAELIREGGRGVGFAKVGLIQSIVAMLIPILSGFLVSRAGYLWAFLVFLLIAAVLCVCMSLLPNIPLEQRACFRIFFHLSGKKRLLFLAEVMVSIYWSFLGLAAGLFLFEKGSSVESTGIWATTGSVIAILTFLGLTRVNSASLKKKLYWVAAALILINFLQLSIGSLTALVVFNLAAAVLNTMYSNYSNERQFDVLDQLGIDRLHGLLVREFALSIGRMVLFSLLAVRWLLPGQLSWGVLAAIGILPIFAVYLIEREVKSVRTVSF